jgi:hypothetical protein
MVIRNPFRASISSRARRGSAVATVHRLANRTGDDRLLRYHARASIT